MPLAVLLAEGAVNYAALSCNSTPCNRAPEPVARIFAAVVVAVLQVTELELIGVHTPVRDELLVQVGRSLGRSLCSGNG
jgi:hypothetical protein